MKLSMRLSALLLCLVAASCVKQTNETKFKADGTGTIKTSISYKADVFAQMKEQEGQADRVDQGLERMSEKRIVEHLKKDGVEVSKAVSSEKDGWKTVETEGVIKDVAAWSKKRAEAAKAVAEESAANGGSPTTTPRGFGAAFYKTDKANVAKMVVTTPMSDQFEQIAAQAEQLENISDEDREQVDKQLEALREQFAIDDFRVEARFSVPGKILKTQGCKADGESTVVLSLTGKDMAVEGAKDGFGWKNGVFATFEFDPKDFKIVLEDEPKAADSRPAQKADEPKKEKKNEEEKKGGGGG